MERRNGRRLPLAHQRTEEFLTDAFGSGAHLRVAALRNLDPRVRRSTDALSSYLILDVNFSEVGQGLTPPSSHETARKLAREALKIIWDNSAEQVQARYPLEKIPLAKPFRGRQSFSRDLSPATVRVAMVATQGAQYDDIPRVAGVPREGIPSKRETLRKRGIEVPYKHRSKAEYKKIVELVTNPDTPREQYEKFVREAGFSVLQHLTNKGALLSLLDALNESGYFVAPSKSAPFRDFLLQKGLILQRSRQIKGGKNAGLIQTFYLVPRRDLEEVGQALSEEASFDTYKRRPVSQLAGPETKDWATTNDFVHRAKNKFSPLGDLFKGLGLANKRREPVIPYREFFSSPDVPVPVFQYAGRTLYPTDQKEALIKFIEQRRAELGI